jgi:hypothetical protein
MFSCGDCRVVNIICKQATAGMLIKLTLIYAAFVPLIIGKASENPLRHGTRVSKVLGSLSGKKKHFCDWICGDS